MGEEKKYTEAEVQKMIMKRVKHLKAQVDPLVEKKWTDEALEGKFTDRLHHLMAANRKLQKEVYELSDTVFELKAENHRLRTHKSLFSKVFRKKVYNLLMGR
jgi:hypothetical protein